MHKDLDKIIKNMQPFVRKTLFDGDERYSNLSSLCKEYLIELGYRVIEPIKFIYEIKKLDELIDYFYNMLYFYHPELPLYKNLKKDRAIAKRFVTSRIEASGINRIHALDECARIVTVVFKHEGRFKFDYTPSFGIFGQGKFGWVTELALEIIANNDRVVSEERIEEIGERFEQKAYEEFLKEGSILDRLEIEEGE